jgi:hypothetical protein
MAVGLTLCLVVAWFVNRRTAGPADDVEVELALPDTPEGNYTRRLIDATAKEDASPPAFRIREVKGEHVGKLTIVVGRVGKVDGRNVELLDWGRDFDFGKRGRTCRAAFIDPVALKPDGLVTVAGDCRGVTGDTLELADCVLLTDAFQENVNELLVPLTKKFAAGNRR